MAERRMFAKSVIWSARFLRMPSTSRLLYYDLGMQADDDGVVEAFSVMRTTGATEDDLRVLASKGFVRVLNEDLVTYISDWNRNNYIQKDRYHPSIYTELLVQLNAETQEEPGPNQEETHLDTECIHDVSKMDTQVRLGKDRLGKERIGEGEAPPAAPAATPTHTEMPGVQFVPPTLEEVTAYVQARGSRVDPQGFIDFYAAKGWMMGKTPMVDWKAACRNAEGWERWDKPAANSERNRVRVAADYEGGESFV